MSGPPTTWIHLVRHGETSWNRAHRLQGLRDVSLNRAGIAQARRLARRFSGLRVSGIVTSPLTRATATADILAQILACPPRADARLREIDHGDWTGLTLSDIAQRSPDLMTPGQVRPDALALSRGELPAAVYRRASAALVDLLDVHAGTSVVVVGHGVTNALLCCVAAGFDIARFPECPQPNAGGAALTFRHRDLVDMRTIDAAKDPA